MDTTSASLLARVRHLDDADAWGRFVRTYSPILYTWTRRLGLSPDDASELVQDVFAVLVQKLPEFEYNTDKQFRGWLWTVTRRRWLDRKRRATLKFEPGRDPAEVPAASEDELEEKEFRAHVLREILPTLQGNFHESTWRAFWRHVVEGAAVGDVAAELGISVASVYKAKLRVMAHLHRELGDLLDR